MSDDWLLPIIIKAHDKRWCVQIGCTTCGTHNFRTAVLKEVGCRGGLYDESRLNLAGGRQIFDELSRCSEPEINLTSHDEACRWLLYFVWQQLGDEICERDLYPLLERTWAGDVLSKMLAHYQRNLQRRARHKARQGVKKKNWAATDLDDQQ